MLDNRPDDYVPVVWNPPPGDRDPVIEAYMKDVDRTLLRESLRLTPEERCQRFESFMAFAMELKAAGERHRQQSRKGT